VGIHPDVLPDGRVTNRAWSDASMTDTTSDAATPAQPALTSEERLRALTGDRKRKAKPGSRPAATVDGSRRPGDLVDVVRERSDRDWGRDQPI